MPPSPQDASSSQATRAPDPRPPAAPPADVTAAARTVAPAPRGPTNVDGVPGYEILGELGRGGMGVVYKARQIKLNRLVALKMILAGGHAGKAELQRFQTEAEAIARLQHPNIVQVYEVGEHAGKPFFSLEFCSGGSLERKLNGTPMPARAAAALLQTLAQAMQAAHKSDIIHRDLKPANILLTRDGTPKITDFGLAKKLDEASQTQSGALMGTPSYMAPEQAGVKGKAMGPAADVYALGAILYELLTGRPPFRAASAMDTIMQVLSNEPVPPRQLAPQTPKDLETICLKCLHKEPARRYRSAAALAKDLERFANGEPIAARPVGQQERSWRWCRRNPVVAGLMAAVAAALLLGMAVATLFAALAYGQAQEALREKREADEQRKAAETARLVAVNATQAVRAGAAEILKQRDRNASLVYAGQIGLALREWEVNEAGNARRLLDLCDPNLRGWEHDYLVALVSKNQRTCPGHSREVVSVAWSSDGRHFASGSRDNTIIVWDAEAGRQVAKLEGHDIWVACVCWSPDGKRLASASNDTTVKVWDVAARKAIHTLRGHAGPVTGVCWSPDGKRLASANVDGTVKLWDADTGLEKGPPLKGHTGFITCVAWSPEPEGRWIASADAKLAVKVWDAATGREVRELKGHAAPVFSLSWRHDSKRLATASADHRVKVWDVETGQPIRTLMGHNRRVGGVAFSPNGEHLASASDDQTVKVWNADADMDPITFRGHAHAVESVAWSPNGLVLASASWDGTVKLWDPGIKQEPPALKGPGFPITSVAWSSFDDSRLASAGLDTAVVAWDTRTYGQRFTIAGNPSAVITPGPTARSSVAWSPDGKYLACGCVNADADANTVHTVKVYDAATGRAEFSLKGPRGLVTSVAWHRDSKRLAGGSADSKVMVWDVGGNREPITVGAHAGWVTCVAWSRDGTRLASSGIDAKLKVWDVGAAREVQTLVGHDGGVPAVCWSPDGTGLASAGWDGKVKVWDLTTGQATHTLTEHNGPVYCVSWSPNGKRLASAGHDGTLKLWDPTTGHKMLSLRAHDGWVTSVAWSPDGKRLASAGSDMTVKVWDTQIGR